MEENEGQLGFDFSGKPEEALPEMPRVPDAKGYGSFVSGREEAVEQFNKKFGAMINKQVRLKLFGWEEEFTGKLLLDDLLLPKSKKDEVPLRIGRVTFDLRDIERCFREEAV